LIDALEDLEDVQSVTTNVDLAEDLLTAMAG
jgi:transcriptional/translational regulatory protein YebC/TACO1